MSTKRVLSLDAQGRFTEVDKETYDLGDTLHVFRLNENWVHIDMIITELIDEVRLQMPITAPVGSVAYVPPASILVVASLLVPMISTLAGLAIEEEGVVSNTSVIGSVAVDIEIIAPSGIPSTGYTVPMFLILGEATEIEPPYMPVDECIIPMVAAVGSVTLIE